MDSNKREKWAAKVVLRLVVGLGQKCNTATDGLVEVYEDFGVQGHQNIDAGTKLDESHFITLLQVVSFFDIPADPTCHRARNLLPAHRPLIIFNNEHRLFIQFAGLWIVGNEVFAGFIVVVNQFSRNGIAVDVDIEGRHEDADLPDGAFEEVGIFDFFDHDDLAIGRCDNAIGVGFGIDVWIAEEIEHEAEKDDARHGQNDPDIPVAGILEPGEIQGGPNGDENEERYRYDDLALAVETHHTVKIGKQRE